MRGQEQGAGRMQMRRLAGEFDKNLNTGEYWYGENTANKRPWYTSGITVVVPEDLRMNPQPTRRGGYGGG